MTPDCFPPATLRAGPGSLRNRPKHVSTTVESLTSAEDFTGAEELTSAKDLASTQDLASTKDLTSTEDLGGTRANDPRC